MRLLLFLLCCGAFFAASNAAFAAESSSTIAQGFQTNISKANRKAGALVSFQKNDPASVELATSDSASRLAGVIDQNPLVSLATGATKVQVVLSGSTVVLVSDINGPIKSSDKITASPIAGIGMLASADSQVVGTSQADFDTANAETQTIQDKSGKNHTVHIGYVPLQVGVAFYQAPGSNFLPPFIERIATNIAGRPVSLMRILISGALILLGLGVMSAVIYGAVRSTVNSLGRNPMAAKAINRGLYQSGVMAVVIFIVALLGGYLILRV